MSQEERERNLAEYFRKYNDPNFDLISLSSKLYPRRYPRGLALIISNGEFDDKQQFKSWCKLDEEVTILRGLFENFGYVVETRKNLDLQAMVQLFEEFKNKDGHNEADSTVIFFLSYGFIKPVCLSFISPKFYTTDGKLVDGQRFVWQIFNDEACPSLRNKPKMFFFLLNENFRPVVNPLMNDSVIFPSSAPPRNYPFKSHRYKTHHDFQAARTELQKVSGMYILMARVLKCESKSYDTEGSLYVKAKCKIFSDIFKTGKYPLQELQTMIDAQVAQWVREIYGRDLPDDEAAGRNCWIGADLGDVFLGEPPK